MRLPFPSSERGSATQPFSVRLSRRKTRVATPTEARFLPGPLFVASSVVLALPASRKTEGEIASRMPFSMPM